MTEEARGALDRALDRSIVQADAGEFIEADEVLAEFDRTLSAKSRWPR